MTATIVPGLVYAARLGHHPFPLDDNTSMLQASGCICGAEWRRTDSSQWFCTWFMDHEAPSVEAPCLGTGRLVHKVRTDGERTYCPDCDRFTTTTQAAVDPDRVTIDPHPARRTAEVAL